MSYPYLTVITIMSHAINTLVGQWFIRVGHGCVTREGLHVDRRREEIDSLRNVLGTHETRKSDASDDERLRDAL
jgi:hypothetical protein